MPVTFTGLECLRSKAPPTFRVTVEPMPALIAAATEAGSTRKIAAGSVRERVPDASRTPVLSPGDPDPVLSDDSASTTGPPSIRIAAARASATGVRLASKTLLSSQSRRAIESACRCAETEISIRHRNHGAAHLCDVHPRLYRKNRNRLRLAASLQRLPAPSVCASGRASSGVLGLNDQRQFAVAPSAAAPAVKNTEEQARRLLSHLEHVDMRIRVIADNRVGDVPPSVW